jgi:hypothetical protein
MSDIAAAAVSPSTSSPSSPPASGGGAPLWTHGHFSFKDLLDIVNPLQHIPVVGSIYRYLTGDEPSGGARIVGDSIYGGPIGFGVSVVGSMLLDKDGKDLGERAMTAVFGPMDAGSNTAVAAAQTPPTPSTPPALQTLNVPSPTIPVQTSQIQAAPSTQMAASLYRSLPAAAAPAAPATPAQNFLAQNSMFQRQMSSAKSDNGQVLNNRPVPLQLSSSLLSAPPHLAIAPTTRSAAPSPAVAGALPAPSTPSQNATAPNPIVQKMMDALDKYDRIKKQQDQDDSSQEAAPGVDLSM